MMGNKEEYLQITITPMKTPKNKVLKWLFWNIYWKVWNIWRTKLFAWIFGGLADLAYKMLSKEEREKMSEE